MGEIQDTDDYLVSKFYPVNSTQRSFEVKLISDNTWQSFILCTPWSMFSFFLHLTLTYLTCKCKKPEALISSQFYIENLKYSKCLFQLWNSLQSQDNLKWIFFSFCFWALCLASRALISHVFLSSRNLAYIGFLSPHSGNLDCPFIPLHHLLHTGKSICSIVNQSDELKWVDHSPWFWCRMGK